MLIKMELPVLAFSIPFLVAVGDLWLHGPVDAPAKHVALGLSLLAVPLGKFEAFLGAQVIWLVLIIASMLKEKVAVTKAPAEAAKEAVVETGPPKVSDEAVKHIQQGLDKFIKNLNPTTNCDGKPWKLEVDKGDLKIYSSDLAGASTKRWKVETKVKGGSMEEVTEELFNFQKRCGANGWDVAIKEGQVLQEFKDGYSLAKMVTNAAGGGAVSSREFIDLRYRLPESHPECGQGTYMVTSVGLDPKKDKKWVPTVPAPDKSYVLGFSYPGGGVRLAGLGNNEYSYVMVSNMNLNGWIPISVINKVTSSALADSHEVMKEHLRKKFT